MGKSDRSAIFVSVDVRVCPRFGLTYQNVEEPDLRSVFSSRVPWVAPGIGILILATGISVSLWSPQGDQGNGPAAGANEGRAAALDAGVELPSLPARNTTGDGVRGDVSSASFSTIPRDSAALEVQTVEPPAAYGGAVNVAGVQDGANLVVRDVEGKIKQHS